MKPQILKFEEVFASLKKQPVQQRTSYAAMYSSWYGGITLDPNLMMIPIDDHGFHRGDAVFEAIKCANRKIYGLTQHLERMAHSASAIGLKLPHKTEEFASIAVETVRASGLNNAILRYYVSRGPGGFSPNPYESIGSQVYLVVTELKPPPAEKYLHGVSAKLSAYCVKEGFFATVKSCNYLQNVLMKKEAVDNGVDFTISHDEKGFIAEGATENFAIISAAGEFLIPEFARMLRGITVSRVMELAEPLIKTGELTGIRQACFRSEDVFQAREAMFFGTTLDCLPVTIFEGAKIGDGKVGPLAKAFQKVLLRDLTEGPLVTKID